MRRFLLAITTFLLLTGCSVGVAGVAAPAKSFEFPPRPRDVSVADLDPCVLLTETQRIQLGLSTEFPPRLHVGYSSIYKAETPQCSTRGYEPKAVSESIELSVTGGLAETFRPDNIRGTATVMTVRGFPALLLTADIRPDSCRLIVDVAPRQTLDVLFADGGRKPPVPQPELCESAKLTADLAMATLLSLR